MTDIHYTAEVCTPTDVARPDTLEISVWKHYDDATPRQRVAQIVTDLPTTAHANASMDATLDDALAALDAEGWEMAEFADVAHQGYGYSFPVERKA